MLIQGVLNMNIHYEDEEFEDVDAVAFIKGSTTYPNISGIVRFYQTDSGVYVVTSIFGLPNGNTVCDNRIFAMHIHDGGSCEEQSGKEAFPLTGSHYNPNACEHPYHAGDLPPLFSANGMAMSSVLISRFTVREIIGKTVIIHSGVDDFKTQPSGNAGEKIACGIIEE